MMAVDEWYYLEWVVYIQLLLGHLFMPRTGPRQGGWWWGGFPGTRYQHAKTTKKEEQVVERAEENSRN